MMSPAKKMPWIGGGVLAFITLFLVSASFPVTAAGLGRLSVNSSLGQPLSAEIELVSLQPGELESLTGRIASQDAFRDSRIEYSSALRLIRFAVDKRPNGQPILKLTSIGPINEPFLDMLVELTWPSGRLLREYPILLDPPGFNEARAVAPAVAAVTPVTPTAPRTAEPAAVKPAPDASTSTPATVTSGPEGTAAPSDTYGPVKKGDNLNKIATQVKPDNVSLEQMLVALYRENKGAFIDSNMNRLKAGQILRVPAASDVATLKQGEAQKEIRVQVANWKTYREGVASSAASGPARAETSNQASGKVTPAAPDKPGPGAESKDVLKLSKVESASGKAGAAGAKGGSAQQDQINALKEEAIVRENALKEANSRVANLEKQIQDMRKLMELKTAPPAVAPVPAPVPAPAKTPEPAKPAADTKVAQVTPVPAPVPAKPAADIKPAEPAKPADVKPVAPPVDAAKPPEPAKPVEPPKPSEAAKPADAKPAAPKPAPAKAPARPPEPDMLDQVIEYAPYALGGLGALAIGFGIFAFMRKRKSKEAAGPFTRSSSILPSDLKPNTTTGKAAGGLIDTGNSSFLTDFDKAGPGTIDTDEVDPVAEAEVYIAYGRDAQAEEILKEAMGRDKSRHEITLKLLEIYHSRKSVPAFEALAKEFKQNVGETHPMWAKAAAMGTQIDPGNSLYTGFGQDFASTASMQTAIAPAEDPKHAPPDLDFDLGFTSPTTGDGGPDVPVDLSKPAGSDAEMSFDLDLAGPGSTPAPVHAESAPDAGGLDFDLGTDSKAAAPSAASPKAEDTGGFDFDLSDLSDDKPAGGSTVEAHGKTAAVNLNEISLDLDSPAPSMAPAGGDGSAVATKLELARAYLEIGDKDGAKDILQEVLREGTAAQQNEAKSIMASL